jgi:hypothetical protein
MRGHLKHVNPPGRHLHRNQDVETLQQHRVHREEVHRQHALGLARRNVATSTPTAWVLEQPRRVAGSSTRCSPRSSIQAGTARRGPGETPDRVLPGRPQHQHAELGRYGRTATPVWAGPTAPDQVPMPAQQRGRLHRQPAPGRAGSSRASPASTAVRPVHRWSGHSPPEHRDLVAQHEQFGVLGRRLRASSASQPTTWQNMR